MVKTKTIGITLISIAVLAIAFTVGISVTNENSPRQGTNQVVSFDSAPVFSKTTTSGESFSLSENIEEGKPTVVYFMASTCTKCAKNWAALNEVYPDYEDRIDFIAVSVDPTDDDSVLTSLAEDKDFVFDTVAGDPDLAVEYEVFKQTAKFAVDRNGNIIERHDGVFTPDEWRAFFNRLL